jgi:ABC-type nickel/cobalt efflux system permease component RcnA
VADIIYHQHMVPPRNAPQHAHVHVQDDGHEHEHGHDRDLRHAHGHRHGHGDARPVGQTVPGSALAMSAPRRIGVAAGCALALWLAVFWAIAP